MEKKEKNYDLRWAIFETIFITIALLLMVIFVPYNKSEKSKAYTNNVVNYADEQITDLTGTEWTFNSTVRSFSSVTININFVSNNQEFHTIYFEEYLNDDTMTMYTTMKFDNTIVSNRSTISDVTMFENYKTITILGGSDVTNTNFVISWLYDNATLQEPEEIIYNINYNLQNVIVVGEKPKQISNLQEINIEIKNFNNYELPQNIMVDGASYNWNSEIGILTIYDATGNVTITVRAEYISGNYSFIELIDSVVLIPLNAFFNLFNFEIFGVNIYALLTATLTLFVIIKILLKVFK